jgi:hypothetical protein
VTESAAQAHEPLLKQLHHVFSACPFDDVRLRQPVSQPLALRIGDDRPRFEKDRDDVRARKKQQKIPLYGTGERGDSPSLQVNHDEAKEKLSYALSVNRFRTSAFRYGEISPLERWVTIDEYASANVIAGSRSTPRSVVMLMSIRMSVQGRPANVGVSAALRAQ